MSLKAEFGLGTLGGIVVVETYPGGVCWELGGS